MIRRAGQRKDERLPLRARSSLQLLNADIRILRIPLSSGHRCTYHLPCCFEPRQAKNRGRGRVFNLCSPLPFFFFLSLPFYASVAQFRRIHHLVRPPGHCSRSTNCSPVTLLHRDSQHRSIPRLFFELDDQLFDPRHLCSGRCPCDLGVRKSMLSRPLSLPMDDDEFN